MKPFVPMLARHLGVNDPELLEKDVRLHRLLRVIVRHPKLGSQLAFKGGTCLIKCYLDYPRFSSDLDFTRIPVASAQERKRGTREFRREVRPLQRELESCLRDQALAEGYLLRRDDAVRYGQSNRMMTVNLRYDSGTVGNGLVKVQVNFDEPLVFPTVVTEARSLLRKEIPPELRLFEGDPVADYAAPIRLCAYDPREILAEKCRAILTRTAAKSRDLVDLFLLETQRGLRVEAHRSAIIEKTRHAVVAVSRYREQAESFGEKEPLLLDEEVQPMLLKPIDPRAFRSYRRRLVPFLEGLLPAILD